MDKQDFCKHCGVIFPIKCPACGEIFHKASDNCPECGVLIPADAKVCPTCGKSQIIDPLPWARIIFVTVIVLFAVFISINLFNGRPFLHPILKGPINLSGLVPGFLRGVEDTPPVIGNNGSVSAAADDRDETPQVEGVTETYEPDIPDEPVGMAEGVEEDEPEDPIGGASNGGLGGPPEPSPVQAWNCADVEAWVHGWEGAWESEDINRYSAFYSRDFYADYKDHHDMDYTDWMADKEVKFRKYHTIEITVSDFQCTISQTGGSISFSQRFNAYANQGFSNYSDYGRTTLDFTYSNGSFYVTSQYWVSY